MNHFITRRILGFCLIAAVGSAWAGPQQIPPGGKTVWDSVYTSVQATRGEAVYKASCASCHGADMRGIDGVLKGIRFLERWRDDSLESVFDTMKTTMPRNDPGTLTDEQYMDVLTYVLKENAYPAGVTDLKPEDLANIQVVTKGGAEPVPTGMIAQTIGCLIQDSDQNWWVTQATELVRTRDPERSTPQKLKELAATPVGDKSYYLVDPLLVQTKKGHRVEVKAFVGRTPEEVLHLISLGDISETCPTP